MSLDDAVRNGSLSRRQFLKLTGASVAGGSLLSFLASCGVTDPGIPGPDPDSDVVEYASQTLTPAVFTYARDALSLLDPANVDLVDRIAEIHDHNASAGVEPAQNDWLSASFAGLARSGGFEQVERDAVSAYLDHARSSGEAMPAAFAMQPFHWFVDWRPGEENTPYKDYPNVIFAPVMQDSEGNLVTLRELAWEAKYGGDFTDCNTGNFDPDVFFDVSKVDALPGGRLAVYSPVSGVVNRADVTGRGSPDAPDYGTSISLPRNNITPIRAIGLSHLSELAVSRHDVVVPGQLLGYLNKELYENNNASINMGSSVFGRDVPNVGAVANPDLDIWAHSPFRNYPLEQQNHPVFGDDPTVWSPASTGWNQFAGKGDRSVPLDIADPEAGYTVGHAEACGNVPDEFK
ncbi:MAG: twin-arginine translocation signal domain-containing protein [Thioalkalivibrio sp.]|nr:twin-arginine translocation signal domain-containing protein [Thioalkalivibrio sp.]